MKKLSLYIFLSFIFFNLVNSSELPPCKALMDFTKYKNITVDNSTYDNVTKLQGAIVPDMKISRSEVIRQLVKKEVKKQNGKLNDSKKR